MNLSKTATQKNKSRMPKTKGQALVEFSLILPLLLLILLGIIDYGRILLIYANVSSSIRDAARNAELLGADANGIPTYASCDTIYANALNVLLLPLTNNNVHILYYETGDVTDEAILAAYKIDIEKADTNPELADFDCDNDATVAKVSDNLTTGDLMVVTVSAQIDFITPILSNMFPSITINFRAQRSVVTNLVMQESGGDTDFDGLDDDWEFLEFGCMSKEYEAQGYIVRPTGIIVDPLTHDAIQMGGVDLYTSVNTIGDPASDYYEFWSKEACLTEERSADLYPDPTNGWTFTDVGCVQTADPDVLLCPVPALEEFNATDDPDGDGCNNGCEETIGGEPIEGLAGVVATDTDGDGLLDGEEVHTYGTNATNPDTDGDGLLDGDEVKIYNSNPLLQDTDGDGLNDALEVATVIDGQVLALSNADCDLDGDGVNDNTNIDPNLGIVCDSDLGIRDTDADGDGLSDYQEVKTGYSVTLTINGSMTTLSGTTNPMKADTDGDGLSDYQEITGFFIGAVFVYLDPNNADTDGDGINDGDEYQTYLDAANNVNAVTFANPTTDDTDGDGLLDGDEVSLALGGYGTLPNNANSDKNNVIYPEMCDGIDPLNASTHLLDDEFESTGPLVNPANLDPDGDSLANGMDGESDGDLLSDCDEVYKYGTNPYLYDTDGDGADDKYEIECPSLNPVVADVNPLAANCDSTDSDGDTLPDLWEGQFGFGCVYNSNFVLRPDGSVVDPNNLSTSYPSASYPSACDVDGLGDPVPYLAQDADGDPDNDGCKNLCEYQRHTDPLNPDTDGDGLLDGAEIGTSPLLYDTDGDGLSDGQEVLIYFSDPLDTDSDNDGVNDALEVSIGTAQSTIDCDIVLSDPVEDAAICDSLLGINDPDTDGDGLTDGLEIFTYLTNPLKYDTDNDGLNDYKELVIYLTNPLIDDTDGDTLKDGEEVLTYLTSPRQWDTDGDGLSDGEEITGFTMTIELASGTLLNEPIAGYNLSDPFSTSNLSPLRGDSDGDGWGDGFEVYLNGVVDGSGNKVKNGTNPTDVDTDNDGANDPNDGAPLDGGNVGDMDGDGLTDDAENLIWNTDPNDPDSDDDGLGDKDETSVTIYIEYYTGAYIAGAPDGLYDETISLNGTHHDDDNDGLADGFDTDGDGLSDSYELYLNDIILGNVTPIDALLGDGIHDAFEACAYYTTNALTPDPANGLHPNQYDTDGDGVGDGDECNVYLTDPLNAVIENDIIISKIPNESFRDLVYAALEHKYSLVAIVALDKVDAEGRYPIAIVRTYNGVTFSYMDVTTAITGACGTTATYDGVTFTPHTNVCGILDTNYTNAPADQVWYAWVAPSAVYTLIQDAAVTLVNPN
jgi:Flp pilus assembly protein TadG